MGNVIVDFEICWRWKVILDVVFNMIQRTVCILVMDIKYMSTQHVRVDVLEHKMQHGMTVETVIKALCFRNSMN
jgi:hypothetical protein